MNRSKSLSSFTVCKRKYKIEISYKNFSIFNKTKPLILENAPHLPQPQYIQYAFLVLQHFLFIIPACEIFGFQYDPVPWSTSELLAVTANLEIRRSLLCKVPSLKQNWSLFATQSPHNSKETEKMIFWYFKDILESTNSKPVWYGLVKY